jgi:hypothetical protein
VEKGNRMSDSTAVPYEAQAIPQQVALSWAAYLRVFAVRLFLTAAVAAVGTVLVVVALMVGVVGAPVIAAAVAYAIHRRRAVRERAFAT